MKKQWTALILGGALMASCVLPAQAASTDVKLVVNGQTVATSAEEGQPYISDNGRTMLPVRLIGELVQCSVAYDGVNNTVTVTNSNEHLSAVFTVGASTCTINGKTVTLDEPMTISDKSRAYVPLRALMQTFGSVEWDGTTRTVTVTTDKIAEAPTDWTFTTSVDENGAIYVNGTNAVTGQKVTLAAPTDVISETLEPARVYVNKVKVIDGDLYLGIGKSGVMGGFDLKIFQLPDLTGITTGTLTYVETIPYLSDYTIADGYIYYTEGDNQGPGSVDPNLLYIAKVGGDSTPVEMTVDFAINVCDLSISNGVLTATDPEGVKHTVNLDGEAPAEEELNWTFSIGPNETGDALAVIATNADTGKKVYLDGAEEAFGNMFVPGNDVMFYVNKTKSIDGRLYLTAGRGGAMGLNMVHLFVGPEVTDLDQGGTLTEIAYMKNGADFTVANGYLYCHEGTESGPWTTNPKALYFSKIGDENDDTVTFTLGFDVNACSLSVEDGVLIATEEDGTRHEILNVPEADSVDVGHMKAVLDADSTLEGFLENDDTLTFEEIACMPGASVGEEF